MKSEIRIPTLLGLGLLITGIVAGVFLVTGNQILNSKAAPTLFPKNLMVSNISANSVSLSWQTDEPTTGFIQAGQPQNLWMVFKDIRDPQVPLKHTLHFVTLTGLQPNTNYSYRINSGGSNYPVSDYLAFKTSGPITRNSYPPLIGQVLDQQSQPVVEALVTLQINGAQNISTITKIGGNFILPMTELKTEALDKGFSLSTSLKAKLIITGSQAKSEIIVSLPPAQTPLIPIILGLNSDQSLTANPNTNLNFPPATASATLSGKLKIAAPNPDLNKDGKVNSLDRIILVQNYGKTPKIKDADLNQDGIVDQKDLTLMNQYIKTALTPTPKSK